MRPGPESYNQDLEDWDARAHDVAVGRNINGRRPAALRPPLACVGAVLAARYGLSGVQLEDLSSSTGLNAVWRAHAAHQSVVVRWHVGRSKSDVQGLVEHLRYLERAGIPAERIVLDRLGQGLTPASKGCFVTVHKFIPAIGCFPTNEAALATIASYHNAVWNRRTPVRPPPHVAHLGFVERAEVIRVALDRLAPDWQRTSYGRACERALKQLERVVTSSAYTELPQVPVHGDARPGNMLQHGGAVHLIDFDFLAQAPRLVDVCSSLAVAAMVNSRDPVTALQQHLNRYDACVPAPDRILNAAERACAPVFASAHLVTAGVLVALQLNNWGIRNGRGRLLRAIRLLAALEQDSDQSRK